MHSVAAPSGLGDSAKGRTTLRPSITAIIPLHNGKQFIEHSLRSILSQTVPPTEIVVVDDGSSDDGAEVANDIAGHLPSFKLLRKPNGGQSSARNFGVARSTGELIAFLDQDDAWYPRHLERLLTVFTQSKLERLGWVYSNLDEIDREGRMVTRRFLPMSAIHPKSNIFHCIDRDMFVLPSASLISREAFESIGGFDERLIGYEDDDLFMRLFRAGYANEFVDEPLSQWRIYSSSTSYSPKMGRSRLIYAEKLFEAFPDDREHDRHWARDFIAPRFIRNFAFDAYKGVRLNQPDRVRAAMPAIESLAKRLGWRRRVAFAITLPVLRRFRLARLLHLMGISRLMRRALRL